MNLNSLLAPLGKYEATGSLQIDITGISYDSRQVKTGHLFAALPGHQFHGSQFVPQAEQSGAVAVLSDRKVATRLTCILCDQPRLALAKISNLFYGYPSTKLKLFGVTGTNGKTTSSFLLRSILEEAGHRSGLIGTIQYSGQDFAKPAALTTPESLDLQQYLARMISEACTACVMEVSSHSLSQHRVTGCRFEAAIFTNLTQDHLDYHKTMEEYFQAKSKLFDGEYCETLTACINADDPYGRRIIEDRTSRKGKTMSYGFSPGCDYRICEWRPLTKGSEIVIEHGGKNTLVRTSLLARYNAYNITGVFAAADQIGVSTDTITAGIEKMQHVPGRLERVECGQPFLILIDYAHTEDAMRQLLETVRPYTQSRLILLFGCGGDRDRGKRPLMGRVAAELADVVILTSDNPRTEDPDQILHDILRGVEFTQNKNVMIRPDRQDAIACAVGIAEKGDTLVLAGKGHEYYQIIGDQKLYFNEREILKHILGSREENES